MQHLAHEEKIMMPLVPKLVEQPPNPFKLAKVVHDKILPAGIEIGDFAFFVGWNIKQLSTLGSIENPPEVAARVFAWGLQHACTPEQWELFLPEVKNNCPPEIFKMMVAEFQIDQPGKIQQES